MSLFGDLPDVQAPPRQENPAVVPPAKEEAAPPAKRARPDGEEDEVLAAIARLSAHAEAPKKAAKVAQLFSTLLAGGSLRRPHAAAAFALLQALMREPGRCAAPDTRIEYAAMLAAAAEQAEQGLFNAKQRPWVQLHSERAELCAKLAADDSHSFARGATDVRAALAGLPDAAPGDDAEEEPPAPPPEALSGLSPEEAAEAAAMAARFAAAEAAAAAAAAELASARRDMLLDCVEVAFSRYKHAWAAATVDVLIEAAHSTGSAKMPPPQRPRLNAIVNRAREARRLRKAGGAGGSEPGPTSFERSERAFAGATFSIRKAVGASLCTDGRGDSSAFGGGGPQA